MILPYRRMSSNLLTGISSLVVYGESAYSTDSRHSSRRRESSFKAANKLSLEVCSSAYESRKIGKKRDKNLRLVSSGAYLMVAKTLRTLLGVN